MTREIYRYRFKTTVSMDDVESSLLLSIWATEALHGESQVRLDEGHVLDRKKRRVVVDASTGVGKDLNRILTGFLKREFQLHEFSIERVAEVPEPVAA